MNDDTKYPPNMSTELINAFKKEEACWCLSGFRIGEYTNKIVPRIHDRLIDVTESYGGVILKRNWIVKILPEFRKLNSLTYNDDVIVGNLFSKSSIFVVRSNLCLIASTETRN